MHRFITVATAVALLTFAAGTATALNQPTKGKSWKTNITVAYQECTAPDIVTDSGDPACSTPVQADPDCGFGQERGLGKLQIKALTIGNTGYRAKMNKLEPNCEGDQLNFYITTRRSGGHCSGALGAPGDCTVADIEQQFASCVVVNQGCKVSGKFQLDGGAEPGQVEVIDVRIENQTNGIPRAFRLGIINGKP